MKYLGSTTDSQDLGNTSSVDTQIENKGYTANTGTITGVKTVAGIHSTVNTTSGVVNLNIPTNTSHLSNDSGFLTSSSTLNAAKLNGAIPSTVTATTQTQGNNSTSIATTAFVTNAIKNTNLVNGSATGSLRSIETSVEDSSYTMGTSAFAIGTGTKANTSNQLAIGKYNKNSSDNVFEVGIGTSDTNRANALAIDWNGNVTIADHSSSVGTIIGEIYSDNITVPNDASWTPTRIGSNLNKGTWIIFAEGSISATGTAPHRIGLRIKNMTDDLTMATMYLVRNGLNVSSKIATSTCVKLSSNKSFSSQAFLGTDASQSAQNCNFSLKAIRIV